MIVEAETEAQASEAVQAGADGVLLDEFTPEQLVELVPRLRHQSPAGWCWRPPVCSPSSRAYAATGIDLISTSAPSPAAVGLTSACGSAETCAGG